MIVVNINVICWSNWIIVDMYPPPDIPPLKRTTTPSTLAPFRVNDIFGALGDKESSTRAAFHHRQRPTTARPAAPAAKQQPLTPPPQHIELLPDGSNREMRTLESTVRPRYDRNNHISSADGGHSVRLATSGSLISPVAISLLIVLLMI